MTRLAPSTRDSALELVRGASAILLVAPHGGRRPPVDAAAPPANLRVNDIYTPEITRLLAARLGASWIINSGHDRNVLDLNRISQVRRQAPWFLTLLAEEIDAILARHDMAEVVFVHGWNVGQPKCDIGIGGVQLDGRVVPVTGGGLTVSDGYVRTRLAALRAACAEARIAAPLGEHYPGSHRNNLLQLFRTDRCHVDDAQARRIHDWARRGRVHAVQLELGIPLRWPGEWQDRFVASMVKAFTTRHGAVGSAAPRLASSEHEEPPLSVQPPAQRTASALQFYDAAVDVGMFAAVGPLGPRSTGGRLLLFLGGQRVALFTGEDVGVQRTAVAPLEFAAADGGTSLRFAGSMLQLEDAAAYVDLEAALAASRVVRAEVELAFRPLRRGGHGGAEFGTVEGHVCTAGRRVRIGAGAFANAGALRAAGLTQQTMVAATFGRDRAVLSRADNGRTVAMHFTAQGAGEMAEPQLSVIARPDGYTPERLWLTCNGSGEVRAEPLSRMAILRPAGHSYLRVTFGVARFHWRCAEGAGLYEHACPVAPPTTPTRVTV